MERLVETEITLIRWLDEEGIVRKGYTYKLVWEDDDLEDAIIEFVNQEEFLLYNLGCERE